MLMLNFLETLLGFVLLVCASCEINQRVLKCSVYKL